MALTELAIKHLKPKEKLYRVTDSHGLCLEVTPAGNKLWRYRFYHLGKAQMTALGKYPTVGTNGSNLQLTFQAGYNF